MRILYHHRTASRDGQDVHIGEMIAALKRRGHEVVVVAPPTVTQARFGEGGGLVAWLRRLLPRAVGEVLELAYSLSAFVQLWRAWKRHRPDVLYERYNLFLLAGVWLRRITGLPMLLEVNAPLAAERKRHGGLALRRLAAWCERLAWGSADAVLPVTRVLADAAAAAGVAERRLHVIGNGVDAARFAADGIRDAARRELGLEGRLVLGFSGFVRPWHGLEAALDAMARIPERPDLHLLVAGDGPARAALEDCARALGLGERLTVLGVVSRQRMPMVLAAVDVALQPSAVPYASPLKLFEYMAAGLAIVAPDQPNIREILSDGRDALLFPPGDAEAFRLAIRSLSADAELRRRLGRAARATIAERAYTWDANAARVEALARSLLSKGQP
jgi:glycosyltransferase involved in cell wall biosynthesis